MKEMKLYGYSVSDDERLLNLKEVTLFADSKQIMALSKFLAQCAQEMEANPEWEHLHFDCGASADLIVANSQHKAK